MNLSRNITSKINYILDNLVPPIIRDSNIFMYPLFKFVFKGKYKIFKEFKENSPFLTQEELLEVYNQTGERHIHRETDLNKGTVDYILKKIKGEKVLDVASGRGYLCKKIASNDALVVYGVDFVETKSKEKKENLIFKKGSIENLDFEDNFFDTVISTHTLEHVLNPLEAIKELRRVTKQRLIVVIPCQRPYKYTFDLHLHFFPYAFMVKKLFNNPKGKLLKIQGDWVYSEDF